MTCLRCGRTVPEDILLCADCLTQKKTTKAPELMLTSEERLQGQVKHLRRRARRHRRWIALLAVLCCLAIVAAGGASYLLRQQSSRIERQNIRINSLETAVSETQSALEQANATADTLREKLTEAQEIIDAYYRRRTSLSPETVVRAPIE